MNVVQLIFLLLVFEDLAIIMSYIDRFKEQRNEVRHPDSTTVHYDRKLPFEIIVPLILIVVVLCFGVPMLFLWLYRKKIKKLKTGMFNSLIMDNSYLFLKFVIIESFFDIVFTQTYFFIWYFVFDEMWCNVFDRSCGYCCLVSDVAPCLMFGFFLFINSFNVIILYRQWMQDNFLLHLHFTTFIVRSN